MLGIAELEHLIGQQLQGSAGAAGGRVGTGQGDELGFDIAGDFDGAAGAGPVIERGVQAPGDKALAHAGDSAGAHLQGGTDGFITIGAAAGAAAAGDAGGGGEQEHAGAREHAGRMGTGTEQGAQGGAVVRREADLRSSFHTHSIPYSAKAS